jgi:hypothetical protein
MDYHTAIKKASGLPILQAWHCRESQAQKTQLRAKFKSRLTAPCMGREAQWQGVDTRLNGYWWHYLSDWVLVSFYDNPPNNGSIFCAQNHSKLNKARVSDSTSGSWWRTTVVLSLEHIYTPLLDSTPALASGCPQYLMPWLHPWSGPQSQGFGFHHQ